MNYDFKKVEQKWKKDWYSKNVFKFSYDGTKPKYYILDMFPYPSGAGLHVGHPKGYTFTDVISRYKRLKGFSVLHPIGFDAFGLPAEQYALVNNKDPNEFTLQNIAKFKEQLQALGFDYDYSIEVNTSDPNYYAWTQWTFVQMYKHGLTQLEEIEVNWCEQLGTVLSNEEVETNEKGEMVSERGGYVVTKRKMWQWVIKITKYADRLLSQLDELDWPEHVKEIQRKWIGKEVDENGHVTYHLNDWVFSRQRYWGEPFPIYYDENNNQYIEENLPLILPKIKDFKSNKDFGTPLANAKEWIYFSKDNQQYHREINTMPNWAGSCWYYLGYILKYLNPNYAPLNSKEAKQAFDQLMNVDLYVGGQEHVTRHLIYARFWFMFLHDIGVVSQKEPFQKLVNQGMILASDGRKMSKSWGNTIDPMLIIDKYGADTLRIYECFMGPITENLCWKDEAVEGVYKWTNRIVNIFEKNVNKNLVQDEQEVLVQLNKTIKNVQELIENYKHNVAISQLMVLTNVFSNHQITINTFKKFLIVLSCFAPFMSQEMWSLLSNDNSYVHLQSWPEYEQKYVVEQTKKLPVQINKKTRVILKVDTNATFEQIKEIALANETVQRYLINQELVSFSIPKDKIILIMTKDKQ